MGRRAGSGTVPLAVVRGVPIRVHLSTLVALPFFAWLAEARMRAPVTLATLVGGGGPLAPTWAWALLLTLGLVGAVVIHEGAHVAAARLAGGRIGEVTVFLFGGCCRASGTGPWARAAVALAGPLSSLLAGIALIALGGARPWGHVDTRYALTFLGQVQFALGAIELLPAPPLDGGRLVIAALERRTGEARATVAAAWLGRAVAVVLALAGAFGANLLAISLAGVLFAGSDESARRVRRSQALRGLAVRAVAVPASQVDGGESLGALAARMRAERAPAFVVTEGGAPVGVVSAGDVGRVPARDRYGTPARRVARPTPTVEADRALAVARAMMRAADVDLLPVTDGGSLVGVLTVAAVAAAEELRRLDGEPASPPAADRAADLDAAAAERVPPPFQHALPLPLHPVEE